ncbi:MULTISPECIES: element excision factor XisH family protein [Okeania]|uniref:Uncharacterized protein n=1 Tax=Okeania hirsuta TaxID=1458930 RepID=A0A3N6P9I7_9CYAN|nr:MULTISPECIES: element excision factor XisH family protein [Okeania]NEP08618.1 hypothetical protein [Okeania sp. SIO4D6]NEP44511.1 hypothetical protein [Okeania sp. SIO2H7]NEP71650.1 hypothetical protein [Okeania sp. SIO2G5]NEP91745.1 hypothetical protein [Okeania sp. SIO2F5]NEQ89572.1 hypothetical protein [Okeania sp. SIO2G4]
MPARDAYHNNLINALVKDNWSITDDPYVIKWGPISVISYQLSVSLALSIGIERLKLIFFIPLKGETLDLVF